jgi:FecR protein
MSDRPLLSPLREADEMLGKIPVPHQLTQRLRWSVMRRAAARTTKRRRPAGRMFVFAPLMITIAAVTAVFLMSMVVWVVRRSAVARCVTWHPGGAMSLQGSCALDLPTMRIESDGAAQLRETGDGVRLLEGTVLFSVLPVAQGHPPVRVWVSGGTIDVLGTQFRVAHTKSGGSIHLIEGTVRFTFPNGDVSLMHAGETLSWGPEDTKPSSASARRARPVAPGEVGSGTPESEPFVDRKRLETGVDLHLAEQKEGGSGDNNPPLESLQEVGDPPSTPDVMRRFEALRREARYTETELLRQQLEPVSFELGNALQRQHAPSNRICNHWRWHLGHFPSGVYNGSIRDKMAKLSCENHPGD